MSLLGIDIGTTGCKAIVFRLDGEILGQSYREYPLILPGPGLIELNPNLVWSAIERAIREAVDRAGDGDPVKAIGVASQGETVTPVSKNGEMLANSITTFDMRGIPQAERWGERLGREKIFQITGMPLHPMYSINKILWWKENLPEVYEQTWKFLCYGDLALYKLGGVPVMDRSMAGRTMAFDLHRWEWSSDILEKTGISPTLLPDVRPAGTLVGELLPDVAEDLGLPAGVRLVAGSHDQSCGTLGCGVNRTGLAMDTTGSVECITPVFDHPVLTPEMLEGHYCCYAHAIPDLYMTLAYNFTGGQLLRWYRDTLGAKEIEEAQVSGLDVYEIIIGNAKKGPADIFVLPHFTMSGTPWLDPQAKGAILGLTLNTDKDEIIKALLDGITYEMRLNLDLLENAGVRVESLRAVGSGARSRIWMQLKANIFNRPVASLAIPEATCLGAAMLAGKGIGEYPSLTEAADNIVKAKEIFYPDPHEAARYEEKYAIYQELYHHLHPLLHRI